MTDTEIILHNLRDRDTESRAALARIVEERDACRASLEAATKRVDELEAEVAHGILEATATALDRAARAEARIKVLEYALRDAIDELACHNGNAYCELGVDRDLLPALRAAIEGDKA